MLTKEKTKQQKGIAILLMLFHHLYIMSDRIPVGHDYTSNIIISNMDLIDIGASFGKICVSIFMFLGGYGIFKSVFCQTNEVTIVKGNLTKRIVNLYRSYWKVFLVFIPVGFVFFNTCTVTCVNVDYCSRFSTFVFKEFVANFFAWNISYNGEWWFFKTYIITLFIGYIFIQLFKNTKNVYFELCSIIIYHIIVTTFPTIVNTTPALRPLLD
ncbi:MAG: acyltransferase family protein, partial [Eubacterium sp.]|nr:acyltransferase family protein [Eubacterium sp.]